MKSAVMFSKASDMWETPQDVFDALDAEFNFAVDAAASEDNAKCALWFGPGGLAPDALALKDWRVDNARRAYWMNPPYSKCRQFIEKASWESRQHGITVVTLVPSRTDTRWWHEHVWCDTHRPYSDTEVRFVRGRLKFGDGKNSAPFPSVVIVFRGR